MPCAAGQLSDELHKTRQQLQTCRNDNVALFEKVCRCGGVEEYTGGVVVCVWGGGK
jgi:hypothetical protein